MNTNNDNLSEIRAYLEGQSTTYSEAVVDGCSPLPKRNLYSRTHHQVVWCVN